MPSPDPVDSIVGARIRELRRRRGVTQHDLAQALGLTFQQIQKYERGFNRVSASKLHAIAAFLEAPISELFAGVPEAPVAALSPTAGDSFMQTGEGREFCEALARIPAGGVRKSLLALVVAMAGPQAEA